MYHDWNDDLDIKVIGHIDLDYFIPYRALRKCSKQRIYLEQRGNYPRLELHVNIQKGLETGLCKWIEEGKYPCLPMLWLSISEA